MKIKILFGVLFFVFLIGIVSAYTISNYDYSSGNVVSNAYYSTGLERADCSAGTDFLIQIEPFSCEPILVTSDLLEEEPVTVYCKVVATQINPFIDVDSISRISITGDYSSDVRSVGFFPSESALGYWIDGSLDGIALNNLGYVAITLRQNPNESSMPDFVNGTLNAKLTYDVENSFGVGNAQFYLPVLNDDDFEDSSSKYSFWNGRGYIRITDVDSTGANVVLYNSAFQRTGSARLGIGEVSNEMFIQGINPCLATFKVRLNGLEDPDTRVRLKVNSDYVEASDEESFLDGECKVKSIKRDGINQEVSIYCKGDERSETFSLRFSPKVILNTGEKTQAYSVGDYLYTDKINEKSVYLGYVGAKGDSTEKEDLFVVLVAKPSLSENSLSKNEISGIAAEMNLLFSNIDTGASVLDFAANLGSKLLGAQISLGKWVVGGREYAVLETSSGIDFKDERVTIGGFSGAEDSDLVSVDEKIYLLGNEKVRDDSGEEIGLAINYSLSGTPKISLKNSEEKIVANFYGDNCESHETCTKYILSGTGLNYDEGDYEGFFDGVVSGEFDKNAERFILKILVSGNSDVGYKSVSSEYYANAIENFETLTNSYSSQTTKVSSETYGEVGLYEAIQLSYSLGQMKTMLGYCGEFKGSYPNSEKDISVCDDGYKLSNSELSTYEIQINGDLKTISFEGIYEPSYEEYGAEVSVRSPNGKTQVYELKKGKKVYLYGLQDDIESQEKVYIYDDGLTKKVYYNYTDAWLWSVNKNVWDRNVPNSGEISQINVQLMQKLVGMGKQEGISFLISQGGFEETLESETTNEYIELVSVDEDSATIKVNALSTTLKSTLFETNTKKINLDESDNFGSNYVFTVVDTNIEKSAKVTVIPSFNYRDSESEFDFNIGIEKRTILLSDEMIDNRISSLNDSIETLNNVVDGLDTFNRALGASCLATGGYLTLKNLIKNSDGSAIAREEVMTGKGGWTERCDKYVSTGTYSPSSTKKYSSMENCFYENSDMIDADVERVQGVISSQNDQIKSLQESTSNNGVIDKTKFTGIYSDEVSKSLGKVGVSISDSEGKNESISVSDIQKLLDSDEAVSEGVYDSEDLKDIQRYAELYASATEGSEEKKSYNDKLYSSLGDLVNNAKSFNAAQEFKSESGLSNSYAVMNLDDTRKTTEIAITEYETYGNSNYAGYKFEAGSANIKTEEYVYAVRDSISGERYLVVYDFDGVVSRTYQINMNITNKTLKLYGKLNENTGISEINPFGLRFIKYDSGDYENKYINAELVYYESGSYKEYPAIVPLDAEKGWYVGVKNSDSGVAAYDTSGKLRIAWICNVGKNGLEEFSIYSNDYGDDKCQQYDLTHDVVTFSGLTLTETNSLLRNAQTSVQSAQNAHRSGVSSVSIGGVRYNVGEPASSSSEIRCESYMSPKDCKLLFNVCDPVVCPRSRCDFGGNYPVKDVVQTGVVGSVLLCAPNYKEDIYLPICTTGVQAGLTSWTNVQESYRDCLQEYLDNGELTGMCDKIHSIYACEFFWKEAIPLAKIGVSKAAGAISGEGVRGGSEYLSFGSAWQNARESVDYFTQYYAAESYNAFKIRSAEEAGSAVCKVSASIVYASGADLLDSLTTPRSPSQYTGSFEESVLTTTTNPPTSHYKVSYYIYAGEDSGVTYQVYLKGSSSSYYQDSSSTYVVPRGSGYISAGGYVSETPDFSTASGYTELCISVNGAVECGFGKVSTSFAENYINDLYLEEQSTQNVRTEEDCTSGTASFYSLINPNLQDVVGNLAETDLYADGITRICATENPGKTTDANWNTENALWRDVGYCGDQNLRCWIDTQTVKDAIKTLDIEDSALQDNSGSYLDALTESGNYVNNQNYSKGINEIKSESSFERKIILINNMIDRVFYSNQKAELFLLRGQAYKVLALRNLISENDVISPGEVEDIGEVLSGGVGIVYTYSDGVQTVYYSYSEKNEQWFWSLDRTKWNDYIPELGEEVSFLNRQVINKLIDENLNEEDGVNFLKGEGVEVTDSDVLASRIAAFKDYFVNEVEACSIHETDEGDPYYTRANCYNSITLIYDRIDVSRPNCIFSSSDGEKLPSGINVGDETDPFKNDCGKTGSLNEKSKLDLLNPGYQFDALINYTGDAVGSPNYAAHSLIFLEWKDRSKNIASVFDWRGQTYDVGKTNLKGEVCAGEFIHVYPSGAQKCKTYKVYDMDLSDSQNYVYLMRGYPEGVVSGTSSEKEFEEVKDFDETKLSDSQKEVLSKAKKCSDCVTGGSSSGVNYCDENLCYALGDELNKNCILEPGTTKSCIEAEPDDNPRITLGRSAILETLPSLEGNSCSGNSCLKDIYESKNVIVSTINTCVYSSDTKDCRDGCNDCSRSKDDLREGDLITIGNVKFVFEKWDNRLNGIVSGWTYDKETLVKKQFNLKTNPINKIEQPFSRVNSDWKDLRSAINYLDSRIAEKRNGGKYSDNKDFVDQIYYEGFLSKTYGEIRGEGFLNGLFNLEENMVYVKDLLVSLESSKNFDIFELSEGQKEALSDANECSDCVTGGSSSGVNYCDENLCYVIGDKIDKNCVLRPEATKVCIEI